MVFRARMIEQAARCGNNDVRTFFQFRKLCIDADATKDHCSPEWQVPAIITQTLADLGRKFSRGCEDQGPYAAPVVW